MQFEEAGKYAISLLTDRSPANLCYHNVDHTLNVYNAAERLGKAEGVNGKELKLLLTAAWFHDVGQIKGRADHETSSCIIAREVLPQYGYLKDDIERICSIIMATKLPQSPADHLGEILADADLDYLGSNDFFVTSEKLYHEICQIDGVMSKEQWNRVQIKFFHEHHYFTKTARAEREAKKEYNLQLIKTELE
jgi:predicted metal-dependent HD superfamily phosphohydrolase